MTELRSKYEAVLPSGNYIMAMIDGKNFSRKIKNNFEKPFSSVFMAMMDEAAIQVFKELQYGCFAYVQSDEITFVFYEEGVEKSGAFFGNRISKLSSIIPSTAAAKFNQLMIDHTFKEYSRFNDNFCYEMIKKLIGATGTYCFDCKVWTCDNYNDVFSYLLWRQIDCIRNSKQQAAQTYLPHKRLMNINTDEQIKLLMEEKGIDWNKDYDDGMKYGRFIYKETEECHSDKYGDYYRSLWKSHHGFPLSGEDGRNKFNLLAQIPIIGNRTTDTTENIQQDGDDIHNRC